MGGDIRLGLIGVSPGNGHPFSFSAIINGYDETGMAASGWDGIHAYLRRAEPDLIGLPGVQVSHVWTQDAETSETLANACRIGTICETRDAMLGEVNGVVIARDDFATHAEMAMPFLEAGRFVFVDKPLCLEPAELDAFMPYLESGRLMSCSGLRYAREMDPVRYGETSIGELAAVHCSVINGWEEYGIHMLDAVFGAYPNLRPLWVEAHGLTYGVGCSEDVLLTVSCLGSNAPVFKIRTSGTRGVWDCSIADNFTAFRRTLVAFVEQMRSGTPAVAPATTRMVLRTLMAGRRAATTCARVALDET